MTKYSNIYNFWFNTFNNPLKWLHGRTDYDNVILSNFSEDYISIDIIKNIDTIKNIDSKMCLINIIILDQFSRHMFRNNKKMYSKDSIARDIVLNNINFLSEYNFYESIYFLMPLNHSENKDDKDLLISYYKNLLKRFPEQSKRIEKFIKIILERKAILFKFKRYPKRNIILERESTME